MSISKRILVATLFLLLAVCPHFHAGNAQKQNPDDRNIPITSNDVVSPKDTNQKRKRQEKTRRYHQRGELKEDSQISEVSNSESSFEFLEALPVRLSDVVAIGEVVNSSAFLTDDKTAIYSEFTVRISEVFKSTDSSLCINCDLTAERKGGAIKFPSGHIQKYTTSGEAMPRVGGRYVLFLKHFESGPDFSLLRAYEITGDVVNPLDSFTSGLTYRGSDATTFLAVLRTAIIESAGTRKENEQ